MQEYGEYISKPIEIGHSPKKCTRIYKDQSIIDKKMMLWFIFILVNQVETGVST